MNAPVDPMEERIREFFEQNFQMLRLEAGHTLAPQTLQIALQQVLLYWRKLQDIANRVTDTEVHLNLPGQKTPDGRPFGIEGVVDIVREHDQTVMYDIKTHAVAAVRANVAVYEKQLNIYAHIWQTLRGQPLDGTAVISTDVPLGLREALRTGIPQRVDREFAAWDPLVEVPFDPDHIVDTIREFGEVVDAIECGRFSPPPPGRLREPLPGSSRSFVRDVCHNCDGRFSCSSYRTYAQTASSAADARWALYFSDTERDDWLLSALDATPAVALDD